jgi:allantoin racemase
MTRTIGDAAARAASPGTEIVAVSPSMGPVSIECHCDEAISVVGLLDEIRKGEADGFDGYVVACFGDPGLLAARELAKGPVVGIAEAAMHVASFIGTGFSVVTTLARTCIIAQHLADSYGMSRFCRNIRGTDLAVLVKLVETLVSLKLGTSKLGDLDYPPAKPYTGAMEAFAPVSPQSGFNAMSGGG